MDVEGGGVEEREVEVVAWWGSGEERTCWITETVGVMVWEGWGEGREEGSGLVVRGEGGRVGIRMIAFVGVGWK